MTTLASVLGVIIVAIVALVALFLGGMRVGWRPVVDTVRRINMRFFNPRQMDTAGQVGAFAGVLRHVGRTSGRLYETPLGIEPTDDGFVIAMVYGERTQWTRNVLASGTATIIKDGVSYEVDRPQVVSLAEAIDLFPASDRRLFGLFGVEQCLRVHTVEASD